MVNRRASQLRIAETSGTRNHQGAALYVPLMIGTAVLNFGKVVLLGRLLPNADFGMYSFVVTLIQYCAPLASLGLLDGLAQRIPLLLGQNQHRLAKELRSVSVAAISLIVFCVNGGVVLYVTASLFLQSSPNAAVCLGLFEGAAYVIFSFVVRDVRNHLHTSMFAMLMCAKATIELILVASIASSTGVLGVFVAETAVLALISAIGYWRCMPPIAWSTQFRSKEFHKTVTEGMRLTGLGALGNTELLGDRLLLGVLLVPAQYAVYAVHGVTVTAGLNVISILNQYALPLLLHSFGRTSDPSRAIQNVFRLHYRLTAMLCLTLPLGCWIATLLAQWWYTSYTIQPALLWLFGIGIAIELANVFPLGYLVVGQTWKLIRLRLVSSLIVLIGNLVLLWTTTNLVWFGAMFLVGRAIFLVLCRFGITEFAVSPNAEEQPRIKRAA